MKKLSTPGFHFGHLSLSISCAAVLLLILGLNRFFDMPGVWVYAIIGTFAAYVLLGLFDGKGNPALLGRYAETVYFLALQRQIALSFNV